MENRMIARTLGTRTGVSLAGPLHAGLLGLVAAAALQAGSRPAVAQPQPGGGGGELARKAEPQGPRVTLNFPGGTVLEYVKAIQKAAEPTVINAMVSADAAKLRVPAVEFKQVAVSSAIEALPMAAQNETAAAVLEVRAVGQAWDGSGIYSISARQTVFGAPGQAMLTPGKAPEHVEVFSMRDLVEPPPGAPAGAGGTTVETILMAVDTAIGLHSDGEKPQVKFHKDSGVLIVRGTQEQIRTVKDLLNTLREDTGQRWHGVQEMMERARVQEKQAAEREHALRKAGVQLDMKRKEFGLAEEAFARANQMREAGQVSQDEFGKAQMELTHRRAEMEMAELEMERYANAARATAAEGDARVGGAVEAELMAELEARRRDLEAAAAALDRMRDRGMGNEHPEVVAVKARADAVRAAAEATKAQLQELRGRTGRAGRAEGAKPAVVAIYDIREYRNFMGDVVELCKGIAGGGEDAVSVKPGGGDQAGSLVVKTTPERQAMIVRMLNLAKRLRANDPKLPGLNVEDVLKGATKE